ncbi:beta-galactosidase small subunit-related protein [Halocatena halophila]|uniref:glycoside hydrolase family 2 TIM barrel-domain containing protein n=1 Tax=Halocatena halophila TaxID=2814576 RepID=UPI002ED570C4
MSGVATLGALSVPTVNARSESALTPGQIRDLPAYLEAPGVFQEHREPTHTPTTVPYESPAQAIESDVPFTELEERFDGSPYFKRLDGKWRFRFFERPSELPETLDEIDAWEEIVVPRPWQTEGYDKRVYTNWQPTWTGYDPDLEWELVPDERGRVTVPGVGSDGPNPVGVYRRTIDIPSSWNDREVFLHFEGVKQAYFVWIDGEYVGFQQGSMTPGEFDSTEFLRAGESHELTVQVYRWSDGEALECIDMHKFAGIYRSVYLFSTPPVHIRDFSVRTELDDAYEDAHLQIDAELADYSGTGSGDCSVRATLYESDGRTEVVTIKQSVSIDNGGGVTTLEAAVNDPAKWSSEQPYLYTLVLELLPNGDDDSASEVLLEKVGFRSYEAERGPGGHITVNGEPVTVRGVNRHETDPDTGRTVPIETMRMDCKLLKRFNLNAIRTSHYPNDPSFYRLADEYGIYIQDEVNCETHWWEGILAETSAYHDQCLERFRRMILRDRNHPSVFSWSTGNEAGTSAEHLNMAALALGDTQTIPEDTSHTTRLSGEAIESFEPGAIDSHSADRIMYHQPNHGGWDVEYSDMLGPRYIDTETLLALGRGGDVSDSPRFGDRSSGDGSPGNGNRSVVMGEYNHAMGNSLGLIDEMWNDYIQPPVRRVRDRTNANDGVLVGSPTVVSLGDGGALALDGGTDYIDVQSEELLPDQEFTIEITVGDFDTTTPASIFTSDWCTLDIIAEERIEFTVGGVSVVGTLPDTPETNTYALAAVCSDDRLTLYVNGKRVASTENNRSIEATNSAVSIGHDDRGRYFAATIASVAVHTTALSPETIGRNEPSDDTVLWYDFDDLLRDKSLQGGFIWDWVNQDLNDETADGEPFQFYHRDGPAGAFCLNGMLWSDRRPQPELKQLKQCHQPVKATPRDLTNGELYVTNHHQFTSLDEFDITWSVLRAAERIQEGTLDLETPPSTTEIISIEDFRPPARQDSGTEYWLELSISGNREWSDGNHEIAFEQFALSVEPSGSGRHQSSPPSHAESPPFAPGPSPSIESTNAGFMVSGNGFEYAFEESLGTFATMEMEGTELVTRGPVFNFWRAPIMNEQQAWGSHPASNWYELGLNDIQYEVEHVAVSDSKRSVTVEVRGRALGATVEGPPAGYETTYSYRVLPTGEVRTTVRADPTDRLVEEAGDWLPKVGLQLEIPWSLDRFEWYGRGPAETYPDRKTGVRIGQYSGSVDEQYVPYLPPQDNGNKADTRWAALTDGNVGIAAFAQKTMNVSLEQYSNLDAANYQYELETRDSIGFNLDHAVTGVGGTPVMPREKYQVQPEPTEFTMTLCPFSGRDNGMAAPFPRSIE